MHGDNTGSKAESTLLTASIIIGKRWGATGSQARWIYNSIVLPGIRDGSTEGVWGGGNFYKTV